TISTSDHLLYLYSRFDLLLLILNITFIILPLGKYLVINVAGRLTFIKCLNKQFNTWKSVSNAGTPTTLSTHQSYSLQYHHHKLHLTTSNTSQKSKSFKSVTLNENLHNFRETDPLTLPPSSGSVSSKSCVSTRTTSRLKKPPNPSKFGIKDRLG